MIGIKVLFGSGTVILLTPKQKSQPVKNLTVSKNCREINGLASRIGRRRLGSVSKIGQTHHYGALQKSDAPGWCAEQMFHVEHIGDAVVWAIM